jgi:hypothetical protein
MSNTGCVNQDLPAAMPWQFVDALADHAETALRAWLTVNAPPAVLDLFEHALDLRLFANQVRAGKASAGFTESILEAIPDMAREVVAIGGAWHGPTGKYKGNGEITS